MIIQSTNMYLSISDDFKKLTENCYSPFEAWETLRLHFRLDNRAQQMPLFSEICATRIASNESVNMFAARLRKLKSQFYAMGDEIPEMYISFQVLKPHSLILLCKLFCGGIRNSLSFKTLLKS